MVSCSKDEDVIKIGVMEPFTGASASGGELTYEGIELANEQVPEVLGKKVVLVKVDNKSTRPKPPTRPSASSNVKSQRHHRQLRLLAFDGRR